MKHLIAVVIRFPARAEIKTIDGQVVRRETLSLDGRQRETPALPPGHPGACVSSPCRDLAHEDWEREIDAMIARFDAMRGGAK